MEIVWSCSDSMKLLNYSVDEIAKAFHLDIQKLEIDYNGSTWNKPHFNERRN